MLDSESKFEKVQGIWFDDIDWGVSVSYENGNGGDGKVEKDCVYLDTTGYAYGCKKVTGNGEGGSEGTAFQRRIGKEKIGLQKNGWGIMVGKVSFVMALIEMVKGNGSSGKEEEFKSKWSKWFEKDNGGEGSCLEVTERVGENNGQDNYDYKRKKCKWKLKEDKKGDALSIFKKVFADEKTWAEKSFKRKNIDDLCGEGTRWKENNFGRNGSNVMKEVREEFKSAHCKSGRSKYGKEGNDYVREWSTSGNIKVIEGQVFEFGGGGNGELLAFEKEGNGSDIFGEARERKRQVTAGDWLKAARWEGKLADQSCSSIKQWNTRNDPEANRKSNDCVVGDEGEGKGKSGKWLNDQEWDKLKKRFGLGTKSSEGNCQWLMKEPFKGTRHEDLRPEHTMVMGFRCGSKILKEL
ncbi:hypothetical protein [Mycoplasma suis]|uniref:Uncharacterized protein n=1 Tax=Mycoplasma suis (strain Illinois) TaxID=768700 RepID=F0QRV2_MYCSL|nr:hypothetical protein [Mycoplasma suis]ADX98222.1 hypothetical protein MSU_0691 [Mycoplasma suis str. Illinois]